MPLSFANIAAVTLAASAVSLAGIWLSEARMLSRRLAPFSGGLLLGLVAFWTLPEMAVVLGWGAALAWISGGAALLWAIDRFVQPVCPSCSHTHDHESCHTTLHGFGAPMIVVAALHNLFEGWALTAAGGTAAGLANSFVAGVLAHKGVEALAFGLIMHAALRSRAAAVVACVLVQGLMIVGSVFPLMLPAGFERAAVEPVLAAAAGSFLFLGFHAVHLEWKRRGLPAFGPALTGAAGAAVLQQGLRVILR